MTDFRFGPAFASGFRLIRRNPLAVGVWGLAYGLMVGLPPWLAPMAMGDQPAAVVAMVRGVFILTMLLGAATLVSAAVYRAVLAPETGRFFHLRLGKAELLHLLTVAVVLLGFILAMVGVALAAYFTLGPSQAFRLAGAAASILLLFVSPRVLAAGPITVAEGRFALVRAWRLTRACWRKGLLLALATAATDAIIYSGVVVAAEAVTWTSGAASVLPGLARLAVLIPMAVAFIALLCFALGASLAIFFAPWATVYRDLTGGEIDVETFD